MLGSHIRAGLSTRKACDRRALTLFYASDSVK
jgi:hypothetical protein